MEVMGTFYKGICKWKSKGKNMLEVGPRETGRRGVEFRKYRNSFKFLHKRANK